jgi:hypothetical protein
MPIISVLGFFQVITIPTDAKGDNIRVITGSNSQISKNIIIGIDNDRALESMIERKNQDNYIRGKNILYFLKDRMNYIIEDNIANHFLSLNPWIITLSWLNSIKEMNRT